MLTLSWLPNNVLEVVLPSSNYACAKVVVQELLNSMPLSKEFSDCK